MSDEIEREDFHEVDIIVRIPVRLAYELDTIPASSASPLLSEIMEEIVAQLENAISQETMGMLLVKVKPSVIVGDFVSLER